MLCFRGGKDGLESPARLLRNGVRQGGMGTIISSYDENPARGLKVRSLSNIYVREMGDEFMGGVQRQKKKG